MRQINSELINEIVEHLRGSCMDLSVALNDFDLDLDDFSKEQEDQLNEAIDDLIFNCESCGWWCEVGDYADEGCNPQGLNICNDCGEEKDEDL